MSLCENSIIHVSETSEGKNKEGKRGEGSGAHGDNDFGMVSRKSGWSVRRRNVRYVFECGLWVMKEVVKVKRENVKLKHEAEVLKNEDAKRTEAEVYEKNIKNWPTITKRITDERTIATRVNNKILRTPPTHISRAEEILPRLTHRTLAQLRTNKSPFLKSYLHKVDAKTHPSPLFPL